MSSFSCSEHQPNAVCGPLEVEGRLSADKSEAGQQSGPFSASYYEFSDGEADEDDDKSDEVDGTFVSEEKRVLMSTELSVEVKRDALVELLHSRNCIKQLNMELLKSLDVAEDCNSVYKAENASLKKQIEGMKQSIIDAKHLMDELDEMRSALAERELANGPLEALKAELQKENKTLKDQLEAITSTMSNILHERELDKETATNLSSLVIALQEQIEQHTLALEEKEEVIYKRDLVIAQLEVSVTEYSTINQDLTERLKHQEDQLQFASVIEGGGSFQNWDGTLSAATQCRISLGQELALAKSLQEESSDEEQREDMVQEEGNDKVEGELQDTEEVEKGAEDEGSEEVLDHERFRENQTETLVGPEDSASVKRSWLREHFASCKSGACAVVVLSVHFLLLLCLVINMVSSCFDPSCMSIADILHKVAHLVQPHCSIHYVGLPPI